MFGMQEIIVIAVVITLIAIFGRKGLKNILRLVIGAKKDLEDVKEEFVKDTKKKVVN